MISYVSSEGKTATASICFVKWLILSKHKVYLLKQKLIVFNFSVTLKITKKTFVLYKKFILNFIILWIKKPHNTL
ncbi:Uncharacterised protein [Myroides odoratus]|nr:hypothetical protein Myrod_3076 [Myroides odoratus DSM 2801]EKB04989.1 hypothetical protein HMPREF9716_03020 [Myroides odoratus CIP 103059]STZ31170.1 Uncharacterised protein [Myroides odoratus]